MKTIPYLIFILLCFSCRPNVMPPKIKKIPVHTFTGKGQYDEITNWFYIRKVADRGFSGYYLESSSKVNDFKRANFIYSKTRPLKFQGQSASEEKVQFLSPGDLPDDILKDLSDLESFYEQYVPLVPPLTDKSLSKK